jgi:hypothetical protein
MIRYGRYATSISWQSTSATALIPIRTGKLKPFGIDFCRQRQINTRVIYKNTSFHTPTCSHDQTTKRINAGEKINTTVAGDKGLSLIRKYVL